MAVEFNDGQLSARKVDGVAVLDQGEDVIKREHGKRRTHGVLRTAGDAGRTVDHLEKAVSCGVVKVGVGVDDTTHRKCGDALHIGTDILVGHTGIDHDGFVVALEQIAVTARCEDSVGIVIQAFMGKYRHKYAPFDRIFSLLYSNAENSSIETYASDKFLFFLLFSCGKCGIIIA